MKTLRFDRGTLLFEGYSKDCQPISNCRWDNRVGRYRTWGYHYKHIKKNGNWIDEAQKLLPKPRLKLRPMLRPYQQDALSSWKNSDNLGIVALPTGSGKTILAIEAMLTLEGPSLVLVPTRALLSQWRSVLTPYLIEPPGVIGDGEFSLGSVTIATFEGALRRMDHIGNQFSLLVVDEVHHFGAGLRDEALAMCTAPARLGLTATPILQSEQEIKLRQLIGPLVFSLNVSDLSGKYLAPLKHSVREVQLNPQERVRYDRCMTQFKKVFVPFVSRMGSDWKAFMKWAVTSEEGRRALLNHRTARRIVSYPKEKSAQVAFLLNQHSDCQSLIFTFDVATAYIISREFLIMPITSNIHRKEREDVLRRFRNREIRALVSCRVLNEGLDVPDAEVVIVVGGTSRQREHVQRVGRCLRPREGKIAKLYELVVQDSIEVKQSLERSKAIAS